MHSRARRSSSAERGRRPTRILTAEQQRLCRQHGVNPATFAELLEKEEAAERHARMVAAGMALPVQVVGDGPQWERSRPRGDAPPIERWAIVGRELVRWRRVRGGRWVVAEHHPADVLEDSLLTAFAAATLHQGPPGLRSWWRADTPWDGAASLWHAIHWLDTAMLESEAKAIDEERRRSEDLHALAPGELRQMAARVEALTEGYVAPGRAMSPDEMEWLAEMASMANKLDRLAYQAEAAATSAGPAKAGRKSTASAGTVHVERVFAHLRTQGLSTKQLATIVLRARVDWVHSPIELGRLDEWSTADGFENLCGIIKQRAGGRTSRGQKKRSPTTRARKP